VRTAIITGFSGLIGSESIAHFVEAGYDVIRLELATDHRYFRGIDTSMSIDASTHSLFGVSKASTGPPVQEYDRYFQMPTACFRGGCLTGPNHAGTKLHGLLSYLMRCTITDEPYAVFGYESRQARDRIHSTDPVSAFAAFHRDPRPAAANNVGGGRESNCSMLEPIALCEAIAGRELRWELSDENRIGDHRWWSADPEPFQNDYPGLEITYGIEDVLRELYEHNFELSTGAAEPRTAHSRQHTSRHEP
jgi:CDP-paratose 2-epimerase